MNRPDPDLLSSWQFELPPELIASRPLASRDGARLLIVDRGLGTVRHSAVRELPQLLNPADLLVLNNTRVIPARLFGSRTATGGRWEGLFLEQLPDGDWVMLCETRGRLQPGESVTVVPAGRPQEQGADATLELVLKSRQADGTWHVTCVDSRPTLELLDRFGSLPLPPYIGRKLADEDDCVRYQTQFASRPGAVAAPTAGLHFTDTLLTECRNRGIDMTELTLHVGAGTFRPVTAERLSDHVMHHEWASLPQSACEAIHHARSRHGRVVAVGTTSVRTLESAALYCAPELSAWEGRTSLFIRPGFVFQVVDVMLTNFHLPGSTLLALVAAFAGYDLIMEAYREAIAHRYRFFSYGDAMLIL